jgi:uncharacterized protein (TIGR03437 family)
MALALTLRTPLTRLIALAAIMLAAVASAAAQTYTFSSCQNAVTLTVKINTVISMTGPNPDGQGGHNSNLIFFGDFILTVNGSTQTYANAVGTASIGYTPTIGNLTTFIIQVAPGGPVLLDATLQGAGDLIPNGLFNPTLPPLSQWTAPSLGMQHDYIEYGTPSKFYLLDSFGNCNGGGPGPGTSTPNITLVISAGAYGGFKAISPGTWIEIYGTDLSPDSREWADSDFNGPNAPTKLDGVQVTINGEKAFIDYVNPTQINAEVPSDLPFGGTLDITVTNNGVTSNSYAVTVNGVEPGLLAPSLFQVGGHQYVTALLPDGVTYILPAGAISGITSRPAKPGETIVLYGIGFGLVTPPTPAGVVVSQSNRLILPLQIMFGQTPAQITFEGLAPGYVGLYQFDVVVPPVPDNDLVPLTINLAGMPGGQTLYIAVHQ